MHPAAIAANAPDRPAIIFIPAGAEVGGDEARVTTFAELDANSNRLAQLLRSRGVEQRASLAIIGENHPQYLEVLWAAQRGGLSYTAVNSHLQPAEARYIVEDCDASVVVATAACADAAAALDTGPDAAARVRLLIDTDARGRRRGALERPAGAIDRLDGWEDYDEVVATFPGTAIADEAEGGFMLYSSGTTGRPKGIQRPLPLTPMGESYQAVLMLLQAIGVRDGDVYLTPAPLYHSAPLAWSMAAQRLGASVVVMERFDAEQALALIEHYQVTGGQFVPTMFVRMLKLPEAVRRRYDHSSLRRVVHAAAPCPVAVKHAMIEWWGPIISEYWSSTEGAGLTWIDAEDWLAHPGSVGQPMVGTPHILDDAGAEVPVGEMGTIWFAGLSDFTYHNDPEKTAAAHREGGLTTVGDMGYVDEEGYVFLTDRQAFTIISGGVNIYPREAEDVLVGHSAVLDAAVLGVPDPDLGEAVKGVVQPVTWPVDDGLDEELMAYCREHLSAFKCPRSIDFVEELPRTDAGKLYKRQLRDRYWPS